MHIGQAEIAKPSIKCLNYVVPCGRLGFNALLGTRTWISPPHVLSPVANHAKGYENNELKDPFASFTRRKSLVGPSMEPERSYRDQLDCDNRPDLGLPVEIGRLPVEP